jgi:hypothetical protein
MDPTTISILIGVCVLLIERVFFLLRDIKNSNCMGCQNVEITEVVQKEHK